MRLGQRILVSKFGDHSLSKTGEVAVLVIFDIRQLFLPT